MQVRSFLPEQLQGTRCLHDEKCIRVDWVRRRKLRLLRVLGSQLVSDRIEELDVALLWILCQCRNETGKGAR